MNNVVGASAHYFVDDHAVYQSVPDDYVAWSVGGNKYPSTKTTGGGKLYGICKNSNSLSIELCDCERNGKYNFTEATIQNAVELIRGLMKKYGVPIENVIRHFDVTGKICPKPFVEEASAWAVFKELIISKYKVETIEIELFGTKKKVAAINLNGNNYCKLRDLHDGSNIKVGYKNKQITINEELFVPLDTLIVDGNNYIKLRNLQKLKFKVSYIEGRITITR